MSHLRIAARLAKLSFERPEIKKYSSWYRNRPSSSQFVADLEGENYKTTVTIMNQTEENLFIDSYNTFGFSLNNGFRIFGPCAVFPRTTLSWNISGVHEINSDSLSLFTTLDPKIDLLVVGVGEPEQMKFVDRDLYRILKEKGVALELLPTHQACATFNFLNAEKRYVAAALLPPTRSESSNADLFHLPDNLESIGRLDLPVETNINPETGRPQEDVNEIEAWKGAGRRKALETPEKQKDQKRLEGKTTDSKPPKDYIRHGDD